MANDYKELVTALRCASTNRCLHEKCKYYNGDKDYMWIFCKEIPMKQDAADAIEELLTIANHYEQKEKDYWKEACEYKAQEPERGKWIKLDMHPHLADHKCTVCGESAYVPTCMGEPIYRYCPNCGARMEGDKWKD